MSLVEQNIAGDLIGRSWAFLKTIVNITVDSLRKQQFQRKRRHATSAENIKLPISCCFHLFAVLAADLGS